MKKDAATEKEFIKVLSSFQRKSFIVSALRLMDTDEKRLEVIKYLKENPDAGEKEVEEKMFYLSIENPLPDA